LTESTPRKIILATDLSPRCDRALDRAIQLADQFGAELIAACVADPATTPRHFLDRDRRSWRRLPDPLERIRWRLKRDVAAVSDNIRVIVVEGSPAEQLADIARHEDCDLIVTGAASPESLGRMFLGSTVNRVLRTTTTPILVVQDRPHGPYRNLAVATDFSDAAVSALRAAAALFPSAAFTLFHGHDVPAGGFVADSNVPRETGAIETEITANFLSDERIDAAFIQRAKIVIGHGAPEALLGDFIEHENIDLTVIGSHGHGALFDAIIGSTAKRLVEALESDLLIIHHLEDG
jgi:nucleotide-binding universal stress UspA family protein